MVDTLTVDDATVATDVVDDATVDTELTETETFAVGNALVGVVDVTPAFVIDELSVCGLSREQPTATNAQVKTTATTRIGVLFTALLRG